MLYQAVYASAAVAPQTPETVAKILETSHHNNMRDELTGVLLVASSCYFQILEGPQDKVEACVARLAKDTRHAGMTVTSTGLIGTRAFPSWLMGCQTLNDLPLAKIAQFIDTPVAFDIRGMTESCDVPKLVRSAPLLAASLRAFFRSSGFQRDADQAFEALKIA